MSPTNPLLTLTSVALAVALLHPAEAHAGPGSPDRVEPAPAQRTPQSGGGLERKVSVMAGLAQWLLFRGGNVAAEYKAGRFVLELSHGQGLDLNQLGGFALTADERRTGTRLRVPWTTGFGVGYRITENLHVLLELKAHHYVVASDAGANEAKYTTFSVGPSAFYSIYLSQHVFLEPNLRFWPNVLSTLDDDRVTLRRGDGSPYEHGAHDFGFFGNINIGYSF